MPNKGELEAGLKIQGPNFKRKSREIVGVKKYNVTSLGEVYG